MWTGLGHSSKLYRMKAMKSSQWLTGNLVKNGDLPFLTDIVPTSCIVCPAYVPQPVAVLYILQIHSAFSLFRKRSYWIFARHLITPTAAAYCPTVLKFILTGILSMCVSHCSIYNHKRGTWTSRTQPLGVALWSNDTSPPKIFYLQLEERGIQWKGSQDFCYL